MTQLSEQSLRAALASITDPASGRDLITAGLVGEISQRDGLVQVALLTDRAHAKTMEPARHAAERALAAVPGVRNASVILTAHSQGAPAKAAPAAKPVLLPGVRKIVAIASGKGGVGKSTVSVNLACALQSLGSQVGLLDCDIYGPSIPLMMGVHERPTVNDEEKMIPPSNYGVKLMSMGFLLEGDQPVIWRGPMIMKTIQQFISAVDWGELDFLLVDLPPGTGDAQLSLCQTVPLDGGVIVTTPQEASLGVVRKGIAMFEKVNVPILGIVENMSYFTTPSGERVEIFGHGGGRAEAARRGIPFLGEIPIFTEIREGGDRGLPVAISSAEKPAGQAFITIAKTLRTTLA
jgi:ATP-binding protein involved in chromosome partitioning